MVEMLQMIRSLVTLGLVTGLATAGAAATPGGQGDKGAERTPVLLELFTSEGCSSCPPADRLLESLDRAQPFPDVDLIVLSEHVDYWNSGGWSDPFSSNSSTARQDRYVQQLNVESPYTPEGVVDGRFEAVGSNEAAIRRDVEKAAQAQKVSVMLTNVSRSGNVLKFHAAAGGVNGVAATFYIALAADRMSSDVRRGENAGRSLTHVAVAYTLTPAGSLKGSAGFSKDLSVKIPSQLTNGGVRLLAFLQVNRTQQVIGAAQAKL